MTDPTDLDHHVKNNITTINPHDGAATRLAGMVARHWCGVAQDEDPQADAWRDAAWRAGQDVWHLRETIRELRAEVGRLRAVVADDYEAQEPKSAVERCS